VATLPQSLEDVLPDEDPAGERPRKSSSAFRTISEVADELDVAQHVLRFWESKFPQVRPLKRGGGRRYYRPEDVDLLRQIRKLLYDEGYTIKGAQKLLRARRSRSPAAADAPSPTPPPTASVPARAAPTAAPSAPRVPPSAEVLHRLRALRGELGELRALLAQARSELR
jgi:DNA-binding transcriptional MerR regulator